MAAQTIPFERPKAKAKGKEIQICIGSDVHTVKVRNQRTTWTELVDKLREPVRTEESFQAYQSMTPAEKTAIKDVGFFIGGPSNNTKRKFGSITERYLIAFDADKAPVGWIEKLKQTLAGVTFAAYTSHSHAPESPRVRILIPMARAVNIFEHAFLIRHLGERIGEDWFDGDVTNIFRPNQPMFWPSAAVDGEYLFAEQGGAEFNPDEALAANPNWQNQATWPFKTAEHKTAREKASQAEDPTKKRGVVGAFCRNVSISGAIKMMGDVYRAGSSPGRYTYCESSTTNGAAAYDNDKFLYSFHATDPAAGLHNAFDLVRIHLFGTRDVKAGAETPIHQLPSYKAMTAYALKLDKVADDFQAQKSADAVGDFEEVDKSWRVKLMTTDSGAIKATLTNIRLILENDDRLKGCISKDFFSGGLLMVKDFADANKPEGVQWADSDTTRVRQHLEVAYSVQATKEATYDCLIAHAEDRGFHPVKDWFAALPPWDGVSRAESLLVDYMKIENNVMVRRVTRNLLLGAYHRIHNPGFKFDFVTVIEGAQGIGKSTFWRVLANEWFTELDTFDTKEAGEIIQGVWFVELGELSALSKYNSEKAKAFLSKVYDRYREPYARAANDRPRQCIFVGTTNQTEYLIDETGNRRFWTLKSDLEYGKFADIPRLRRELLMIWAEVRTWAAAGETVNMDVPEVSVMLQEAQNQRVFSDPWGGEIAAWLDREPESGYESPKDVYQPTLRRDYTCVMEIWYECLLQKSSDLGIKESRRLGRALRTLGWDSVGAIRWKKYGVQKSFKRPDMDVPF